MSSVKATNPRTPREAAAIHLSGAPFARAQVRRGACNFCSVGFAGLGLCRAVFSRPVEKVTE